MVARTSFARCYRKRLRWFRRGRRRLYAGKGSSLRDKTGRSGQILILAWRSMWTRIDWRASGIRLLLLVLRRGRCRRVCMPLVDRHGRMGPERRASSHFSNSQVRVRSLTILTLLCDPTSINAGVAETEPTINGSSLQMARSSGSTNRRERGCLQCLVRVFTCGKSQMTNRLLLLAKCQQKRRPVRSCDQNCV